MDDRIKQLIENGDALFSKRSRLMSLWQDIAENFYPERASFTVNRTIGDDFASNLTTSYPLLARRELGDTFSSMLRPSAKNWFSIHTTLEYLEQTEEKRWLQRTAKIMRRAMYDRHTMFGRATKEADHDFATFGNAVLSIEADMNNGSLLYRCWHLRDVAWSLAYNQSLAEVHRRWKPTARELVRLYPGKCSSKVTDCLEKHPGTEIDVRHVVVRADDYPIGATGNKWKTPYVSIMFEKDTAQILEESGSFTSIYVIPRWATFDGSQYGHSPAVTVALPEARLIQAMSLTLLEAGEKAVNPPLIGVKDAMRSDLDTYAGGVTWIDREYDEKTGEPLRPLALDHSGLPFGMEYRNDTKEIIKEAFYLNKIAMPPVGGPDMTAYEVGQRVQEYIRGAIPLFEPMEIEYNGAVCEMTFEILQRLGVFGPINQMPESLRKQDIEFRFTSPLHDTIEQQKGQIFTAAGGLISQAVALDQGAGNILDPRKALRDALDGSGVPAEWLRSEEEIAAIDEQAAQQAQAAQTIQLMQAGGEAAKSIGEGGAALNGMMGGEPMGSPA